MSQSACFAHVVQWVHVGTVDSMRARNGSGQIQLMGAGCYRVRISAGYDPVTGKRRQPSKVVHGTRQDAERARAELLLGSGRNRNPEPEINLQDLVSQHLDAATRSGQPRSPYSRHREHRRFQRHISTLFGNRVADGIKPQELTLLYDSLLTKGLSRAERLIVILYYYEEMTMKEIGVTLDLSESRVSQMHSSILARLKAQMQHRTKDLEE